MSQIKVYFSCGCLVLKFTDKSVDFLGFEPTGKPQKVSWYAEIADLNLAIILN